MQTEMKNRDLENNSASMSKQLSLEKHTKTHDVLRTAPLPLELILKSRHAGSFIEFYYHLKFAHG